jgi:hypothetical protein
MRIETFITYRNLRRAVPTSEEFHARLSLYDRRQMLWLCAAISFSLDFVVGAHTEEAHSSWVRRLFPTPEAEWILRNKANVFHRHQLLFLMQEVARFCPEFGDPSGTELPLRELGELFLMANDVLNISIPEPSAPNESSLQLILMLLPSNEANLFTNAFQRMGRSHLIVTRIAESRRHEKAFFDIRDLFQQASGIPYGVFEAMMVVVFTRLVNVPEALKDASKFGIDESYFAKLPLPSSQIEKFFALVSANPDEFRTALTAQNPRPNDFRVIRNKPLVKIGNRYFPLDAQIGFEKFDSAVYWSILRFLPKEQREIFPVFWGGIFEDYVIWLLQKSVNEEINRIIPNPRYSDNADQQVCDVIVQCDGTAIFVEVKGNMITSKAKYSGDIDSLRDELEQKWVGGSEKKKGVTQLVPAIKATCSDEAPRRINGIDMRTISTIIPLVVTRDEFGGYMGVNTYLNNRFRETLGKVRYRKSITPLLCMCVDSLEKLSPYLEDTRLSELLSVRLRGDKKLSTQFFDPLGPYLKQKNSGKEDRRPTILKDATFDVSRAAAEAFGLRTEEVAASDSESR